MSRFVLAASGALVLYGLSFTSPTHAAASDQLKVVKAEGCGSVDGGAARARDEAIIDALQKALVEASGAFIESDTLVRNGALFDAVVRTRVPGFVKTHRVLEGQEGPRPGGLYCVTVEAWVVPEELKERLPDLAADLSVVVQVPEVNCGRPQAPRIVENVIISKLVSAGYRVLDVRQLGAIDGRDLELACQRGDREAGKRLRLKFLTSILVCGQAVSAFSQDNQGIVSARAQVEARAVAADTAQILWNFPPGDAVGFGAGCDVAGRRALQAAGGKVAEDLLEALDRRARSGEREVTIELRGVADVAAYRQIKTLAQGERWVRDVREGQFTPGRSTLYVRYPEKTIYLATGLARRGGRLRLVEFTWSRIVLEVVP